MSEGTVGDLMLVGSLLLVAALAASLLAGRLRVPGLLLFLLLGMAVGSEGLGLLHLDNYELARDVGIVALAFILYEGGLSTDVRRLRPLLGVVASLALVGTLITAILTGLAATFLFELSLLDGLLIGAIVAATDAAAIFALLRGSHLRERLTMILEGEAGSNDPVAILLVIGFIEWITHPGYGVTDMLLLFVRQLGIGAVAGLAVGWFAAQALRRTELPTVGLYPVASLTAGALAFGAADVLGGSGFLAIYLAGLSLSAAKIPAKRTMVAFHGGVAWVSQLVLFLTLGLLVFPSQLDSIAVEGTVLALILAFVARPIATLAATFFFPLRPAERVLLGWSGMRGAVPVVLATFPVIAGVPRSLEFFNIVFFSVLVSLLLQGPTFEPLARRLGLTTPKPEMPEPLAEMASIRHLGADIVEYQVGETHAAVGARVRDLGLPREAVVNVIVRGGEAIPPRGSTRIQAGDRVHILVRREVASEIAQLTRRWRNGPVGPPQRPRRSFRGASPVFTVRPYEAAAIVGEVGAPTEVMGQTVVARLRAKRDGSGAVVALEDGRYAITGSATAVGSRHDVKEYVNRRLADADEDEAGWLRAVIGTLAVDAFE